MTTQTTGAAELPEALALQLAEWLEFAATNADMGRKPQASDHRRKAAAELRRLYAENRVLMDANNSFVLAQDRIEAENKALHAQVEALSAAQAGVPADGRPLEELLVWAVEDGVIPMNELFKLDRQDAIEKFARRFVATTHAAPQPSPSPAPACQTCNDNGMIGGPSFYQPDEGGVPCPDCTPVPAPATSLDEAFASARAALLQCPDRGSVRAIVDVLRARVDASLQSPAPAQPVHGDLLPPVGSRVFIRHGRDDDAHACTVTGYYAWGDLDGDKRLHRVFVRLVYEGTTTEQARMLCDCHPTAEAALAAQREVKP